jgi:hypothetical protein
MKHGRELCPFCMELKGSAHNREHKSLRYVLLTALQGHVLSLLTRSGEIRQPAEKQFEENRKGNPVTAD